MTQHRQRTNGSGPRPPRPRPSYTPRTIDYGCKRCGLTLPSQPLSPDPRALPVYGLPKEWQLGSALAVEFGWKLDPSADDFCLCSACTTDVRRGAPLDMRDLGRSR